MTWSTEEVGPQGHGPCLCLVKDTFRGKFEYMVLYYHPRKGWVFRESLALSRTYEVVRWLEIKWLEE